ncbi:glycerate kinase [Crinalium epipsammum PCC 9333]|uniref:Glycerate kinase n=1 Tax=Crinalium epipsammum PCC 9333 TaxID=1173022 RepID=K9W0U7_9CYAN|nr:glycerate kinase [Crinalium epipsammum]AFZ13993.1 glycerate kinase [Crinalium epipsammum PCC 9333]
MNLIDLLEDLAVGKKVATPAYQQLTTEVLADELRAKAFGITIAQVEEVIKERSSLFPIIYPEVLQFCHNIGFEQSSDVLLTLWNLWLPLAINLAANRQQLERPLIQGIVGGQGTGKSTLAAILKIILKHLGYHAVSISLDDLYKTYAERLLLIEQDPRLIWRGPPGTHDLQLGLSVLEQLREADQQSNILIPRFDKSAKKGAGDRTQPELIQAVDIVLFEGWFVGIRPITPTAFEHQTASFVTETDKLFARDMNARLSEYLPLWQLLDRLILLYPVDYHLSQEWRLQAEHQMIAAGKSGMTDSQIKEFVNYFWKSLHPELFIKPLITHPSYVDLVIEINADQSIGAVYRPCDRLP